MIVIKAFFTTATLAYLISGVQAYNLLYRNAWELACCSSIFTIQKQVFNSLQKVKLKRYGEILVKVLVNCVFMTNG